jgi:heme oxygenase
LLQENTSALHAEAEISLERRARIETPVGLSHFLECMLQTHLRFHDELDVAAHHAGITTRSAILIDALAADLNRVPDRPPYAKEADDGFSLGVGYVMEGSALGAGILRKRLLRAGMPVPAYLSLLTRDAKERWPYFVETLDKRADSHESALAGANSAFAFIIEQSEQLG